MQVKKDIFNGNIKREFMSYTWTSIIIVTLVFFACGALFLYVSFFTDIDAKVGILLLTFGIVSLLFSVCYPLGTIFLIRKYPRHKRFVKIFLNSEFYFVTTENDK